MKVQLEAKVTMADSLTGFVKQLNTPGGSAFPTQCSQVLSLSEKVPKRDHNFRTKGPLESSSSTKTRFITE